MQPVKLQVAVPGDLPRIRALAEHIWNQHYPPIIGQAQVDYMLQRMYSSESLNDQLMRQHHRFYLVNLAGREAGFISVYKDPDGDWFISKFYIDQNLAGKGIGSAVFEQIKILCAARSFRLTVNRQNIKAINFYFKLGFRIEKVADFDIGGGYVMNDFVMRWNEK